MKINQSKILSKPVPYEHNKTAFWVVSDVCNYRCRYCFTLNKKESSINSLVVADALVEKLKGVWEIILSGGEPFAQKKLFAITDKIIKAGHHVSIYTNFSAESEEIIKFLKKTDQKLSKFFASLHLEYIKADDFLNKVLLIEERHAGFKKHLLVHIAGTPDCLLELERIKNKFYKAGVQLIVFPLLNEDLRFFKYSQKQKTELDRINNNHNLDDVKCFSVACSNYGLDEARVNFKGRKCPAGHESIFLVPTGEVYSCLRSNRAKIGFLGNILSNDFKLNEAACSCPYDLCTYPASYTQYYWCLNDGI